MLTERHCRHTLPQYAESWREPLLHDAEADHQNGDRGHRAGDVDVRFRQWIGLCAWR